MANNALSLPANISAQNLPPQRAIDYLKTRGLDVKITTNWQDVWRDEQASSFTVSRLTNLELLNTVNDLITQSLADGTDLKTFSDQLRPKLAAAGWWGERFVKDTDTGEMVKTTFNPSRLQIIYDTNISAAYAAGAWDDAQASKETLPYLMYLTRSDEVVRSSHRQWHAIVLPVDDPFWKTHYPPNGWRCRCWVIAIDNEEVRELSQAGVKIRRSAPPLRYQNYTNKRTGEVISTPVGIDPGFAYNVGEAGARVKKLQTIEIEKLKAADSQIAKASIQAALASQAFADYYNKPKGDFAIAVISKKDAAQINAQKQIVVLSEESAIKQKAVHSEIMASEYIYAQAAIERGIKVQDSKNSLLYILDEKIGDAAGYVTIIKSTQTGQALFLTSFRRLSRVDAFRDKEIARLLKK